MSEFVFDDGRKAESIVNNPDPMTKIIEVYVEPKHEKKLAKRITEKFCVCEREIEMIDESTGDVISKTVESVYDGQIKEVKNSLNLLEEMEKRVSKKRNIVPYLLVFAIVAQVIVLAYIVLS